MSVRHPRSIKFGSTRTFLFAAAAAVVLFAPAASAAEIFKIGLIASFTGAFASWGTQFQNAIEAYQAVNGKTVKGPKGELTIRYLAGALSQNKPSSGFAPGYGVAPFPRGLMVAGMTGEFKGAAIHR